MNKTLVAYFSATGVTAKAAGQIAEIIGADLFAIEPEKPYTAADLNWNDSKSRSSLEMHDPACRPAIASHLENFDDYKTVFLGFPVWWYEAPRIIHTFLESYDFSGKIIIPFITSGGSGLGRIPEILHKTCPKANWQQGRRVIGGESKQALALWLNEYTGWKQ